MRQWWIGIILVLVIAASWVPFLSVIVGPPAKEPVLPVALVLIVFGTLFPILLWKTKLVVTVDTEILAIAFTGIGYFRRRISLTVIAEAYAKIYSPIKEYGGWGIKSSRKYGHSYTISGNQAVQIILKNGKKILIGSQKADELAAAINIPAR